MTPTRPPGARTRRISASATLDRDEHEAHAAGHHVEVCTAGGRSRRVEDATETFVEPDAVRRASNLDHSGATSLKNDGA